MGACQWSGVATKTASTSLRSSSSSWCRYVGTPPAVRAANIQAFAVSVTNRHALDVTLRPLPLQGKAEKVRSPASSPDQRELGCGRWRREYARRHYLQESTRQPLRETCAATRWFQASDSSLRTAPVRLLHLLILRVHDAALCASQLRVAASWRTPAVVNSINKLGSASSFSSNVLVQLRADLRDRWIQVALSIIAAMCQPRP